MDYGYVVAYGGTVFVILVVIEIVGEMMCELVHLISGMFRGGTKK